MATDYDTLRVRDREDADPISAVIAGLGNRKAAATAATLVLDDDGPALDDMGYPSPVVAEVAVVAQQRDEFLCTQCFLIQHRSRHARSGGHGAVCRDCA